MIKWIKNSKASKTNKSSKYKGIRTTNNIKKYEASISISKFTVGKREQIRIIIGNYSTEEEARKARVKYILEIL